MNIFLKILLILTVIYVITVMVNLFFGRKKKRDTDGTPPDDRYPLW